MWCYINNGFVKDEDAVISIRDLSLQRGYGVFDFFRCVEGNPLYLNNHIERFFSSAYQLRLTLPLSKNEIERVVAELILRNGIFNSGIRLQLTGGPSADATNIGVPNLIIYEQKFMPPSQGQIKQGIKLFTYPHQRQLPHVKSIDYLMATWLQPLIKQKGADDVLYCNNGYVTECPRSNFFVVTQGNKIVTPAEKILKGITRERILELANKHFAVEERPLLFSEIKEAKEAFITSTTKKILPVKMIDDVLFEMSENSITMKLLKMWEGQM